MGREKPERSLNSLVSSHLSLHQNADVSVKFQATVSWANTPIRNGGGWARGAEQDETEAWQGGRGRRRAPRSAGCTEHARLPRARSRRRLGSEPAACPAFC